MRGCQAEGEMRYRRLGQRDVPPSVRAVRQKRIQDVFISDELCLYAK